MTPECAQTHQKPRVSITSAKIFIGSRHRANITGSSSAGASNSDALFPAGKHDDMVDAVSGANWMLTGWWVLLESGVRTEVNDSNRWRDPPEGRSLDFPSLPMLAPNAVTTFRLSPPGGTSVWRAAVHCMRHYAHTDTGRRQRDFDWYVRKKAFIDTTYSERISR